MTLAIFLEYFLNIVLKFANFIFSLILKYVKLKYVKFYKLKTLKFLGNIEKIQKIAQQINESILFKYLTHKRSLCVPESALDFRIPTILLGAG